MFASLPVRAGCIALVLALTLPPASSHADGEAPPPCLWSNALAEGGDLLCSPVQGTWEGYVVAAGFAGGLAVGLHNDLNWYDAVQAQRNPWQDKVMPVATLCGDGLFHLGAYAALYHFGGERDRRIAAQAVEGQILVAVLSQVIKFGFTAARPTPGNAPDPRVWFTLDFTDASFASGHAMTAFCAAAILGRGYQAEWLTYPLAALVAYSRVYNQRHFPSDVVAGAGLGLLIGQTVVAFHAGHDQPGPAVRFSVTPAEDGGKVAVTWAY